MAAMFVNRSGQNEQSLQRTFHRCFLRSFGSIGLAVSEEKIFRKQPNRNKKCLWQPFLLMDQDKMSNIYRGPSIDTSYQFSVHLAKQFQKRSIIRNRATRNKKCLWWPILLTDQDKMSNLYRGPSIDTSYQVSVHLAKQFQKRFIFRTRATRNKNVCVTYLSGSLSSSNVSINSFSALSLAISLIPCQIEQFQFL